MDKALDFLDPIDEDIPKGRSLCENTHTLTSNKQNVIVPAIQICLGYPYPYKHSFFSTSILEVRNKLHTLDFEWSLSFDPFSTIFILFT